MYLTGRMLVFSNSGLPNAIGFPVPNTMLSTGEYKYTNEKATFLRNLHSNSQRQHILEVMARDEGLGLGSQKLISRTIGENGSAYPFWYNDSIDLVMVLKEIICVRGVRVVLWQQGRGQEDSKA